MKRCSLLILILGLLVMQPARAAVSPQLKCLWSSYRNFKITADKKNIYFSKSGVMPYGDGEPDKPRDVKHITSIDQMFYRPYPFGFKKNGDGNAAFNTPILADQYVGVRYQPLFKALYGYTPAQVENDLVSVQWVDGTWVLFNRRYGAAKALQNVVSKLRALIKERPELKKYLVRPQGTYEWRRIANSTNLSMHSFGVAIDINLRYSDYWWWDMRDDHKLRYRNRIPIEIPTIFEQNGFTWGGKWYRYDTMHFEYRPELTMARSACEKGFENYRD